MRVRGRGLALAVITGLTYAVLGHAVAHTPPGALDRAGSALFGQTTGLAIVLTSSCWWPVLLALALGALILAALVPAWRGRALFGVAVTLAGWQTSDALKLVFARPRPPVWLAIHETSFAYSSGHAMFAVLVFGLWSWYVARSTLPQAVRIPLATLLALWAAGVIWSRLALGAHYITDLIGGVLLALTVLGLGIAVAPHASGFASGRSSWHTGS